MSDILRAEWIEACSNITIKMNEIGIPHHSSSNVLFKSHFNFYIYSRRIIMSKEINVKGPDFVEKQPTPYLYEAPANVPFPEKHQSGKGGPSDCNNNGIDDSKE